MYIYIPQKILNTTSFFIYILLNNAIMLAFKKLQLLI